MSLRLSATLLESFRLVAAGQCPESELLAHVRGQFSPTRAIEVGKAYDALLQKPQLSLAGLYEKDGYRFDRESIERMLRETCPDGERGIFQVKATRIVEIPATAMSPCSEVRLVAKADHLLGPEISEFKTTLDDFDAVKYRPSMQWRVMAYLFESERIIYRVASLKEDRDTGVFSLRSLDHLSVYPYPKLEQDCLNLIQQCVEYIYRRGLESDLTEKTAAPAGVAS